MLAGACAFDSSGFPGVDEGEVGSAPGESVTTLVATTSSPGTSSGDETSTDTGTTLTTTTTATSATTTTTSSSESGESDTTGGSTAQIGPFAPPEPLDMLNSPWNDDDPTVRTDYVEIFFASDRPGGYGGRDIWTSTRPDPGSPWTLPTVVSPLASAFADAGPELSNDGLVMFLSSDRPGGLGGHEIYVATRATIASAWTSPTRVAELATIGSESSPTLSTDLLEMFYCSAGLNAAVYRATRPTLQMPWVAGTPVVELDDPLADDCSPFRMIDGVRLAFASNRAGGHGAGDLWIASRVGGVFTRPEPIEGVNDLAYEDDPWIAPDGALIVFASNRGDGDFDLWAADAAE